MQRLDIKLPRFTNTYDGSLIRALVRSLEQAFQRIYFDNTKPVTELAADYTVAGDDSFLLVDSTTGDVDITVPESTTALVVVRRSIVIKKLVADNVVNVIASGTDTIDGGASVTLSAVNSVITLRAIDGGWVSI